MREPDWLCWPAERVLAEARIPIDVVETRQQVYQAAADDMLDELKANNAAGRPTRWILPVGPTGQYPLFVQQVNAERLSLADLHTVQMDEYCDWRCRELPPDHFLSFSHFFRHHLFEPLDPELRPPPEQHHKPDPRDLDALSAEIAALGGMDTCYGGIGINGHLAFNEPPYAGFGEVGVEEFRQAPTRIVVLGKETLTIGAINSYGGNLEGIPPLAVTIGMRDMLAAPRFRLYVHRGPRQQTILRRAVLQDPTVRYPVTLAQGHPDARIVADRASLEPPVPPT